jgi:hypothetical protein
VLSGVRLAWAQVWRPVLALMLVEASGGDKIRGPRSKATTTLQMINPKAKANIRRK